MSKNINILGLDLSTNNCTVALLIGNNTDHNQIKEISLASNTIRAQQVLLMIKQLLEQTNIQPRQLTALALGVGPGSFTGLKIASCVIQGLNLAWQKPIIKISSLAALALQGYEQSDCEYIMPCIDARMNQVYYGIYKIPKILAIQEDLLENPKNIKITSIAGSVLVVGDGAELLQQNILLDPNLTNIKLTINPKIHLVQAASIVKLAEIWYKNNFDNNFNNNFNYLPNYLKLY